MSTKKFKLLAAAGAVLVALFTSAAVATAADGPAGTSTVSVPDDNGCCIRTP
jgi:hypothetical protein